MCHNRGARCAQIFTFPANNARTTEMSPPIFSVINAINFIGRKIKTSVHVHTYIFQPFTSKEVKYNSRYNVFTLNVFRFVAQRDSAMKLNA